MKNYSKTVFVVMMALLSCFQANVWASGDPDDPEGIPVEPLSDPEPNPGLNPGPRMRARGRYIEEAPVCTYYDGQVTIEADSSVTFVTATVERVEDNATWTETGMGDTLVMSVTDEPGSYILTFTLSNGKSYIGKYILY